MGEVYYLIYTTSRHYDQECPSYLMLVNGHMLQSNLYDATKYTKRDTAEKELEVTANIFKDKKFEIIPVDRRIFGEKPRWVEDY